MRVPIASSGVPLDVLLPPRRRFSAPVYRGRFFRSKLLDLA